MAMSHGGFTTNHLIRESELDLERVGELDFGLFPFLLHIMS